MKKESIWLNTTKDINITKLKQNIETDILIIGGGMTGLNTLYNLKDEKRKIVLVEANTIGSGVTSASTAKINYLQDSIYYDISKKYGRSVADMYLNSQIESTNELISIIDKENISCDLERVTSYIFTNDKNNIIKLKFIKNLLTRNNIKVIENEFKEIENICSIGVKDTYVFHPLKYLYALKTICIKSDKQIYEQTKITKLKKEKDYFIAYTDNYKIKARRVVIACHYPFFLFPLFMPLTSFNQKSYILAIPTEHKNITAINIDDKIKSIRYYNNYLIYLSETSNISNNLNEKENYNKLLNDITIKPDYIWKNDDIITVDKLPIIGKLKDNLYIATGFNTWGMTNSILASLILKDLLLDKDNKYISIFTPKRIYKLKNIPNILYNVYSNIRGFIFSKVIKQKHTKRICPHMGCTLIFNEVEKTWDCPCHASRFDINGKCIKGPSKYDING